MSDDRRVTIVLDATLPAEEIERALSESAPLDSLELRDITLREVTIHRAGGGESRFTA